MHSYMHKCTSIISKFSQVRYADSWIFHQSKGLESASGLIILLYCSISSFINSSGDRVLLDSGYFQPTSKFFLFRGRAHSFHYESDSDLHYPQYPDPLQLFLVKIIEFLYPPLPIYLCHRNFNHSRYILSNKSRIQEGSEVKQLTDFNISVLLFKIADYSSLNVFGQLSVIITNVQHFSFSI